MGWTDESVVLTLNGVGLEHVLLLKTLLLNELMLWSGLDDLQCLR